MPVSQKLGKVYVDVTAGLAAARANAAGQDAGKCLRLDSGTGSTDDVCVGRVGRAGSAQS